MAEKRKMSIDRRITPSPALWFFPLPLERVEFQPTGSHRGLQAAQFFRGDFSEEATTKQQTPASPIPLLVSDPTV
ncbi:hypothetical protein [Petrachloros mirabilis]